MTLVQKKIAAFGVFLLLFILQTAFSINALYNLHISHHVIEEEWEEFNRIQALEDNLDGQSVALLAVPEGGTFVPDGPAAARTRDMANGLDRISREYQLRQELQGTPHERVEDSYLGNIVGPLKSYLDDYDAALRKGGLNSGTAREFAGRLTKISGQIQLLRRADAEFARAALDKAKKVRQKTLRNSLTISILLVSVLVVWGIYFLVNFERQTQLEIYQQKIMTAGLLAQSLAHEIRNPLGVIKSAADLLAKRQSLDRETRELAGYMVDEVARIDSLIKELLNLSRRKSEAREDVDVGQIIRSVLDLTGGKLKQAGVSVQFTEKSPGVLCSCAPGQIRQVVLNLVLNALDASPRNGSIDVTAEKKDSFFMIKFRDYGRGIPDQNKDRIFDLFYTTKDSGFGIGLAVVKRIVNEHGGEVRVQSWPGQGSLFTVILPLRS